MKPKSVPPPRSPNTTPSAPLALMQAGDFANAAELFRQLARRQPDLLIAHAGLGRCAARLGRRKEALSALTRAARIAARGLGRTLAPDAALDVAFELHAVHAFNESLPLIDAVLRVAPALARAHHMKAQVLERSAQTEAARASAERAVELAPDAANAQLLLATLEARCADLRAARERLKAIATCAQEDLRPRVMQELARVLERGGDHALAFDTQQAANAALLDRAISSGFDSEWIFGELERERRLCTADWLARNAFNGDDGRADPIFLIGFYRSGTTLLDQMFASHSRIVSSGEAALLPAVLHELAKRQPAPGLHWTDRWAACGPDIGRQLRALYFEVAEQSLGTLVDGHVLLDKTTMNSIHVGIIRALFPRAHIVFAQRDPRDALISAFMQSFDPTPLTRLLLDWPLAARFLAAVLHHWQEMKQAIGPCAHDVRYEDLVVSPQITLSPVLESSGLTWETALLDFHLRAHLRPITTPSFADVTRPLNAQAIGRWRHHAQRFEAQGTLLDRFIEAGNYAR
ncbi:tetratricopeptide repeat-containing sulfotransferase family protein [Methyloversatilis discipulorum]|uniref:tetratricopeptide repeat-containing sulfotransferase family protein n=1 Tax=Methyloversatilis discipulorum TaxID=1119528 RepID=UPI001A5EFD6A|nr:tetratricopeptide repeat-containing sulfotransferase family protein [Methyloversatilis discipulorum]MBL8469600.1 sulfotransferase [Methyloversatilis discipulorum]